MELVRAAEEKSRAICEDCGEPGVLRTDRFWLRTLCDECNGKQPRVSFNGIKYYERKVRL